MGFFMRRDKTMLSNICFPKRSDTLHVSKVPRALREPAIYTGYRPPNQPWCYYLFSLFHLHNETVNVWSHIGGVFAIIISLCNLSEKYSFLENKHLWPVLTFGISCIITCVVSSIAHLFHSKSTQIHYSVFMLDYVGVAFYSYGTGVLAMFSCSSLNIYNSWRHVYLPFLVFSCWLVYIFLCFAKCRYGENPYNISRKMMQVGSILVLSIVLIFPFGQRYLTCFSQITCSLSSLQHITVCIILFVLQAFFFGSHVPEKLFPGKCDIVGQGHQIFHILSIVTQTTQIRAVIIDMESGASDHTDPVLSTLLLYTFLLLVVLLSTFLIFRKLKPGIRYES